jgi:ABC-2 type transport system ATP-binding protein
MDAARNVLQSAGFSTALESNHTISIQDDAAIEQPENIATRLVNAGHPPTLLQVDEEDLEHYFLRLVGMTLENSK